MKKFHPIAIYKTIKVSRKAGLLLLLNAAVIIAVMLWAYTGLRNLPKPNLSLENFIANHLDYRAEDHSFYVDDFLKDSINSAIGRAISDCVDGKNKFEGLEADDCIFIKPININKFKQANWNELILCNYIHETINGNLFNDKDDYKKVSDVLCDKIEDIKDYYGNNQNTYIDNAVKVVQHYVNALKLDEYLFDCRKSKLKQDEDTAENKSIENLAPNIWITKSNGNDITCGFTSNFIKGNALFPNNRESYIPRFRYHDGKLYIAELTSWEEYIGAKKGKEEWAKNNDQEKTKVESLDEFETKGKWVLDRLSGLVEPPTKELWEKWYPKQNKQ